MRYVGCHAQGFSLRTVCAADATYRSAGEEEAREGREEAAASNGPASEDVFTPKLTPSNDT